MQVASKQCFWSGNGAGTVVEVEMTSATGLFIQFHFNGFSDRETVIDWGDGGRDVFSSNDRVTLSHTYAQTGKYKIRCKNVRGMGFRWLDGQPQYAYDGAILSIVDNGGTITGSNSGAFKSCANLKRVIWPNCSWMGQRDFANCTSLEEVVIGNAGIYYDGTFQNCPKLTKLTTGRSWTCWSYVWQGCTALTELKLGDVNQFATDDFGNTPLLKDIWIANKTVDQIRQVAAEGNIVAGYGARFPWGACPDCRFHGTDGVVRGDGTRIA